MTSVYESALGDDFRRLHPRIRERYGFDSDDGAGCFAIEVTVTNPLVGFAFGYSGTFTADREPCDRVPAAVREVGGGGAP